MFKIHTPSSKYCLTCFIDKKTGFLEYFIGDDPLCQDCRKGLKGAIIKVKMKEFDVISCYLYSDLVRTWVILYKEAFDELLHRVFPYPLKLRLFLFYSDYVVVSVPSTKQAFKRRGYDHMGLIAKELGLPVIEGVLRKSESPKQSTLSVEQRAEVSQYFHVDNVSQIVGKKVILIDDVVTTGASLKACHRLLSVHCKKIQVIGLCVHPKLLSP